MCNEDTEELNILGSIIFNDVKDAFSSTPQLMSIEHVILRKLAAKQGLHGYAANALREIKRREALNEKCWISIDGNNLFIYGEVITTSYAPLTIDSFTGPATLISSELSEQDITFFKST